jgi:hypothetical protein
VELVRWRIEERPGLYICEAQVSTRRYVTDAIYVKIRSDAQTLIDCDAEELALCRAAVSLCRQKCSRRHEHRQRRGRNRNGQTICSMHDFGISIV